MTLNLELREGEPDSCGHYLAEVLQRNHCALEPGQDDKWSWRVLWYRPDWPGWENIDETMTVRRWAKLPSESDMLDVPLGAFGGWQSIDTAPKDGTWVLVWYPHSLLQKIARLAGGYWYNDDGYHAILNPPSHWQPLPKGPDAGKEGE